MKVRPARRYMALNGGLLLSCLLALTLAVSAPAQTAGTDYGCRTLWAPRPVEAFTDLGESAGYVQSITDVVASGIMTGCAPGRFCPTDEVSRQDMAFAIINARHRSSQNPLAPPFAFGPATGVFQDVPVEHPMACWIERFYAEGMTAGCAVGLYFCPQDLMTRAQMAVFILKAKYGSSYTLLPCEPDAPRIFSDAPCAGDVAPYVPYIEQIWTEGITVGCATAPLRYCPDNTILRRELAVYLNAAFLQP